MHAADLLSKRADLTPQREALVELETGRRFTYAQLNARANCAATLLRKLGVRMGDKVSVLAHNSITFVDLLYGCGKIGAVFTPLNWRLLAGELSYIIDDCQPKILVYGPEFASAVQAISPASHIDHVLPQDHFEDLQGRQPANEPERPAMLGADSPYCILYTSGTTGRPKGAVIPHGQVLWNAINTVISWELAPSDVSPILTPMFHSGGLFVFLTPLLYIGGRIVLAREFDVDRSLRAMEHERCTVVLGVPTIFQIWLESPLLPEIDFSTIRWFISGGAPCPPQLIKTWWERTGCILRQGYGLTEVGPNCFCMSDEESQTKIGSVGKPIFHSQMRMVDPAGNDVSPGSVGELIIRGPHVCAGYLNNSQATADSLRDGWFYTGDMARQDEDGFFYISGRFKDMIISGGENVYAAEVEAALLQHPAVAECALIGQPHQKWGEVGLMVTVVAAGQTASEDELLDFCRQRLARYKVPKQIIFTDSLPYSPYGKVQKQELRLRYVAGVAAHNTADDS